MTAQPRAGDAGRPTLVMVRAAEETSLRPFRIVEARELGGWVVIHAETLKVVEPGYLWRRRERAIAWAHGELRRMQREAVEYRRRQEDLAHGRVSRT
jgi:hypothetical protein